MTGRRVRTLLDARVLEAGIYAETWDGSGDSGNPVAAGVYFYRMQAAEFHETRKLVLVR